MGKYETTTLAAIKRKWVWVTLVGIKMDWAVGIGPLLNLGNLGNHETDKYNRTYPQSEFRRI